MSREPALGPLIVTLHSESVSKENTKGPSLMGTHNMWLFCKGFFFFFLHEWNTIVSSSPGIKCLSIFFDKT